jgi:hypothetical protein
MRIRINLKDGSKVRSLRVKTNVKAGGSSMQHNQTLSRVCK